MTPMQFAAGALLACALSFISISNASPRHAGLERGPHAVGLKVEVLHDRARLGRDKTDIDGKLRTVNVHRPVKLSLWYPAAAGGTPMKNQDYYHLRLTLNRQPEAGPMTVEEARKIVADTREGRIRNGADAGRVDSVFQSDIKVSHNAPHAPGSFPILIMPSGAYDLQNAELCEFLASHGYMVVHTQSVTPSLDYVSDLEFAVNHVASLPGADASRLGATGFSYGGLVATLFHLRGRSLDALVSLDGVDGWKWGVDEILASPYYSVRKMDVPILRFHNPAHAGGNDRSGLDWRHYDAIRYAPITRIDFDHVNHNSFLSGMLTNLAFSAPSAANTPAAIAANVSREALPMVHRTIHLYTLQFLNAHVKKDPVAIAFLKNTLAQNGLANSGVRLANKDGIKPPPSSAQIAEVIMLPDGVATVRRHYNEIKARGEPATILFTENLMNVWGYNLKTANRLKEAISAFQLNVEAFPESANVHDSLAEALAADGQRERALDAYRVAIRQAEKRGEAELVKSATEALQKLSTKS